MLIGGAAAVGFVRGWRRSSEARRREEERSAWRARKDKKRDAVISGLVSRYFPFLDRETAAQAIAREGDVTRGLASALQSVPGVIIGEGPWGLPITLPTSVRNRQAVALGKTGGGKTSTATHVIDYDIQNNHSVLIVTQEHGYIERDVLPRIPLRRAQEVVYLSLHPDNPTSWNAIAPEEGESPDTVGLELGHAIRMARNEPSIGGRSDAIERNLYRALVHYPSATLLSIRPFLEDKAFRENVLKHGADEECRAFWQRTFPRFPPSAILPLLVRVDQFTSSPQIRKALCASRSSFSLSRSVNSGITGIEFAGTDPDSFRIAVSMLLARVQSLLMRRDRLPESERPFLSIVLDEFHLLATPGSEYVFRQLLSRSRRMNAAILLLTQHAEQIPLPIRDEIFGNVGTLISFAVGAKTAAALSRELTVASPENGAVVPIRPELLVSSQIGSGYARIGPGALTIPVKFKPPLERRPIEDGERVKEIAWRVNGRKRDLPVELSLSSEAASHSSSPAIPNRKSANLADAELKFLRAVIQHPGQPSAEYSRKLGLNGTKAAGIRKTLVELRLLREHSVARKAQGKPALILEPLDAARALLGATADDHK
jgi:hypothetical protein